MRKNTKLDEKLKKVNDNLNIYMYDNGYMFEIGGRDADNEYKTVKIVCTSLDELIELLRTVDSMERDT